MISTKCAICNNHENYKVLYEEATPTKNFRAGFYNPQLFFEDVLVPVRCFTKESLEAVIDKFTYPETDQVVVSFRSGLFALFTTMLFIENNFRVVEIPLTFKVRIGTSKTGSDKKINGLRYFLSFMWYILRR